MPSNFHHISTWSHFPEFLGMTISYKSPFLRCFVSTQAKFDRDPLTYLPLLRLLIVHYIYIVHLTYAPQYGCQCCQIILKNIDDSYVVPVCLPEDSHSQDSDRSSGYLLSRFHHKFGTFETQSTHIHPSHANIIICVTNKGTFISFTKALNYSYERVHNLYSS